MWQFAEACRGLKDACLELGIPVTGGNVSLYNQTGETAILPTPVVAVLGVIDDVTRRTPTGFGVRRGRRARATWCCCSARPARSSPAPSGRTSCTATSAVGHPWSTWPREKRLAELLHEGVGLLTSAHDLSDGGLAQALVEASLRHMCGVRVTLRSGDPFVALFSESAGRVLVTVAAEDVDAPGRPGRRGTASRHQPRHHRRRHADRRRASSTSTCSSCARPGWRRSRRAGLTTRRPAVVPGAAFGRELTHPHRAPRRMPTMHRRTVLAAGARRRSCHPEFLRRGCVRE